MKLHLLRHGEISSNKRKVYSGRSDEELTATGRVQVKEACPDLARLDIESIICSPLIRTKQTAKIIVNELGREIPVIYDESFNELIMGPWEGMAERSIQKQYPKEWTTWNSTPGNLLLEGRETLQQLKRRVVNRLEQLTMIHRNDSVLIVTHVAIIRVIVLCVTGRDLNQYKSIPVDNAKVFTIKDGFFG